ncbi:MAG TPA: DUF4157 domain-containing protein [Kofleriaceae bacterium]|nr:DUF4157 domain-containing protein [Kofleriaceae bacterium]
MLGGGGLLGAVGGAIGGALSAIGSLFFKAESGGARGGVDRGALESRLGPGELLDGGAHARMGAAFGHDFSRVRVHADHNAAQAASNLNARAFTLGNHVAFAAGQYRPGHPVGDALLAHELAHVVQQGGAVAPSSAGPSPELEEDADTAAASAMIGLWSPARARDQVRERKPQLRSGLRLQRCAQQKMQSNIGVARPLSEAVAEVPTKAKTPAKPPLEGFAAAFPDAAALIKQSPSALAFVKQAEDSGALFGGYTEDEGKIWPFTRQHTVFIPRSQTDPVEAMSSFLFELNNAMRASQFADISRLGDRGKLDAKRYARMTVAVEVEGTLALAELWVKMKTELKGDYSKRDKDFYLSEYNDYKAGRLSKDQIIDRMLQEPSGEDPSKTTEMYYMDKYYEMQKYR